MMKHDNKYLLVKEAAITPIINYWFINSTMDVCQIRLGKDKEKDRKRKQSGNFFNTKECCQKALSSVKIVLFELL